MWRCLDVKNAVVGDDDCVCSFFFWEDDGILRILRREYESEQEW